MFVNLERTSPCCSKAVLNKLATFVNPSTYFDELYSLKCVPMNVIFLSSYMDGSLTTNVSVLLTLLT